MESVKEFFESLPEKVPAERAAGITNSYLFEISDVGTWLVDVNDGSVGSPRARAPQTCASASPRRRSAELVSREQNPLRGVMTGKIKVDGNMGAATKLGRLFGWSRRRSLVSCAVAITDARRHQHASNSFSRRGEPARTGSPSARAYFHSKYLISMSRALSLISNSNSTAIELSCAKCGEALKK